MASILEKNVSDVERVFRFVGGGVLTSLAFWGPKKPVYLLGSILMVEGLTGRCPFYGLMGINMRDKGPHFLPN